MSRSSIIFTVYVWVTLFLIPTTAQAADIGLSDTCTLADAITAANTDAAVSGCLAGDGADTISLSGDITLTAALPQITSEIVIEGGNFAISGNNQFRILVVRGGRLTLTKLTITNGFGDWGGAIANIKGTVIIKNNTISNNLALEGGAIGNDGTLTISNSDVINNSAEDDGGAIHNVNGELNISGATFSNNSAKGIGGAIHNANGTLRISSSMFVSNSALDSSGGAIHNQGVTVIVESSFTANHADISGGALFNFKQQPGIRFVQSSSRDLNDLLIIESESLHIENSIFSENTANRAGGAISNVGEGGIAVSGGMFNQNEADYGGAIDSNGHLVLQNSLFLENSAMDKGGAIYITDSSGRLGTINSAYMNNSAGDLGGAIYIASRGTAGIMNSTFADNSAVENGGALYVNEDGFVTLRQVTMSNNKARRGTGLYRNTDSSVYLQNTIIAGGVGTICFGRLNQNIGNLIEDGSCFATLSGDPMLGELVQSDDGLPAHFPLLEGSPAIDSADDEYCPDADIIGTPRPQGAGCDIGSYELAVAP